jgi:uridine phosphorylase
MSNHEVRFESPTKGHAMEFHIQCDPAQIARYVLCPGDHARAKKIADHFDGAELVSNTRGYVVYSGHYEGAFMTAIGTGMGGPTVAIALEELAHMGADTFIRVGSCGVFQPGQTVGDVIVASGTARAGGTGNAYLPPIYPAVPTYTVLNHLVEAARQLSIPVTVGVGIAGDAFYAPRTPDRDAFRQQMIDAGLVSIEMESDTLFIVGMVRRWRTGAIFASDGTPTEVKPEWGRQKFIDGEQNAIRIALRAMRDLVQEDGAA